MKEKISQALKKDFFERFATLITGAFTFVAALAWNSAIQELIQKYISPGKDVLSMFLYAILVTLVAVIAIMQINAIAKKIEKETESMEKKIINKQK